uniref:Putative secreted protein n=1 Tax=Anopheles triannulatus TaxID=58253 RepID=A0A2M4B650_9DIPT
MVLPPPNGPPRCLAPLVAVVVPVAVAAARKHLTAEQINPHQRHPAAAVPEERVCTPDGASPARVCRPSSGSSRAALLFR